MTLLAQTPSLRLDRRACGRAHGERSERLKMQISDWVDTALTRARQARLPSPLDRGCRFSRSWAPSEQKS